MERRFFRRLLLWRRWWRWFRQGQRPGQAETKTVVRDFCKPELYPERRLLVAFMDFEEFFFGLSLGRWFGRDFRLVHRISERHHDLHAYREGFWRHGDVQDDRCRSDSDSVLCHFR